jgi:acetolactate synthase-1/2/3 large subunit
LILKSSIDGSADYGMTFQNPDFVKYAQSYGACGTRVEAIEDLPILERAFTDGGLHLVPVPVDYSENLRVLVEESYQRRGSGAA